MLYCPLSFRWLIYVHPSHPTTYKSCHSQGSAIAPRAKLMFSSGSSTHDSYPLLKKNIKRQGAKKQKRYYHHCVGWKTDKTIMIKNIFLKRTERKDTKWESCRAVTSHSLMNNWIFICISFKTVNPEYVTTHSTSKQSKIPISNRVSIKTGCNSECRSGKIRHLFHVYLKQKKKNPKIKLASKNHIKFN